MSDYFDNFPNNVKAIGLSLSGGLDSALAFYCLLKTIEDRKLDTKVYTMHGYDTMRTVARSYQTAENVYNWVVGQFNLDVPLLHTFAYHKNTPVGKYEYHYPNFVYLQNKYGITDLVMGDTLGMPNNSRPIFNNDPNDPSEEEVIELSKKHPLWFPWARVDKKHIAKLYNDLNLHELSKLTVSCISDSVVPCKECWWCEERKWAFGNYDGGVD